MPLEKNTGKYTAEFWEVGQPVSSFTHKGDYIAFDQGWLTVRANNKLFHEYVGKKYRVIITNRSFWS